MSARRKANRKRTDKYGRPVVTPVINLRVTNEELKKNARDLTEDDGFGFNDVLAAVASNPDVYEIAKCVPERRPGDPGRPADYPVWVYVIWQALILMGLSQRGVRRQLKSAHSWRIVLECASEVLGADAVRKVPLRAPRRHHWRYWSNVLCDHFDDYRARFKRCAHAQAQSQGLLTLIGARQVNDAVRGNNIAVDGKVFSSPSKHTEPFEVNKETGELVLNENGLPIKHRIDPAGFWAKEGGVTAGNGQWAYGPKYVTMSCRGDTYYSRVVLDIATQTKGKHSGGEAGAIHRMLGAWLDEFDGAETVSSDGILRGIHIRALAAKGVRVVGPTHAKSKANKSLGKGRVPKNHSLGTIRPTPRCSHQLAAVDGRVTEVVITETTDVAAQPLAFRLTRAQRKNKTVWYHQVTIPCRHGDKTINGQACHQVSVPAVEAPTDDTAKFNRAEVLRQVPPGTDLYDQIKGWHKDAESVHAQYELALWQRRICAYGNRRQLLVLFGLALGMNSLARWIAAGKHLDSDVPPDSLHLAT